MVIGHHRIKRAIIDVAAARPIPPAIDFAPNSDGGDDLDGHPYGVDIPAVPNVDGPVDLGAYEAQPITDRIFADGFGDPVSLVTP